MFSNAIMTTLTVSILGTSILAPVRALAESTPNKTTAIQRDANGVADHRTKTRDHRTKTTIRDHRTVRENEIVIVADAKKDCRLGTSKLHKMGYQSIHVIDCSGNTYHYIAMDEAALFAAEMNAYSGDINVTFVGITG